jgi:hypothetical protein
MWAWYVRDPSELSNVMKMNGQQALLLPADTAHGAFRPDKPGPVNQVTFLLCANSAGNDILHLTVACTSTKQ